MNLNLMTTPIVSVVGDRWTSELLDQQTAKSLALVEELTPVLEARARFDAAAAHVEKLAARRIELDSRSLALTKSLAASLDRLRDAMVSGDSFEKEAFREQGVLTTEARGVGAAIDLLVVDLLPNANADLEEAKLDYFRAQAAGILQIATERAERIVTGLAAIADTDALVEVDLGKVPTIAMLLSKRGHLIELASGSREQLKKHREYLNSARSTKG
jgi:hypothetical protein